MPWVAILLEKHDRRRDAFDHLPERKAPRTGFVSPRLSDYAIGVTDFVELNFGYAAVAAIAGGEPYFGRRPEADMRYAPICESH